MCMATYFHVDLVMSQRLVLGIPILPGAAPPTPHRVKGVIDGWSRQ